ncbi:hypothetical protein D7X96_00575 [Corallococcus interemptor]|uniref:WD40 repeat domain-containing protein n=1 Tax=Corallococcus interemptor TaxID=2316720 RepID=A0A3A8R4B7_9BACT|nr:hypothetical protein D7X96_00575 [Corallococcus interemptor]
MSIDKLHTPYRLRWWKLEAASDVPACAVELALRPAGAFLASADLLVAPGPPVGEAAPPWRPRLLALSTTDGAICREEPLPSPVTGLGASRNGLLLVTTERDGAFLWDVEAWRRVRDLPWLEGDLTVREVAFSRDSRFAAAVVSHDALDHQCLYLWDLTTNAPPWHVPIELPFVWSVAFHPRRPLLVVGGSAEDAIVVDVNERRVLKQFTEFRYASNLDFNPGGELLVESIDGRGFAVHDFETGKVLFSHSDNEDCQTSDAVFSPDGRFIAWAQGDGTVGLWGVSAVP